MEFLEIGLDLGFSNVKAIANNGRKFVFPSIISETGTELFENMSVIGKSKKKFNAKNAVKNLKVEFGDEKYYIGQNAINQGRNVDNLLTNQRIGKESELILGLTAIGLLSTNDEIRVDLMLGLPLTELDLADKLKKLFKGTHKIDIYDNKRGSSISKKIIINSVKVIQQSVAALYSEVFHLNGAVNKQRINELRDLVAIVDIGYRTTDLVVTKDLGFITRLSSTIEIGVSDIYRSLKQYLKNSDLNFDKNLAQIEEYVKKGYLILDGEKIDLTEQIEHYTNLVAEQLTTEIRNLWKDSLREFSGIYFVGGGSILLEEKLRKEFKSFNILEEPQFSNAKGYLAYLNVTKRQAKRQGD